MAADEYYDAVGDVLSYVLSAEDFIIGQRKSRNGKRFLINRDGTVLDFYSTPSNRYFTITYEFSLSQTIVSAYEDESELLHGHLEQYEIDDSVLRDENLHKKVALKRVSDVDEEEAERILQNLTSVTIHSDCRVKEGVIEQLPHQRAG